MKRKGARVMVGFVLVCLLIGMLGVYSASGWPQIGLTYRLDDWGGLKMWTQSGFGGELLVTYYRSTSETSTTTQLDYQPSVLYRFKGSSDTSTYVGLGYLYSRDTYANWITEIRRESGTALFVGLERRFGENFSVDLRTTAYVNNWEERNSWEDHGTRVIWYTDAALSIFFG